MRTPFWHLLLPVLALAPVSLGADDLLGAKEVLRQLGQPGKADTANDPRDQRQKLARRMVTYFKDASGMKPEQAAAGWVSLYDDFLKLSPLPPSSLGPGDLVPSLNTLIE